jgi:serine phosphatase RsbU (regulator of sigma subunit)
MLQNVRRFARKVLLAHLVILLIVIALVVLAARSVYDNAHAEVVARAKERQQLLATETVNGISAYYASILSGMDAVNRNLDAQVSNIAAGGSDTADPAARVSPLPARRALLDQEARGGGGFGRLSGAPPRDAVRQPPAVDPRLLVLVWRQLSGRISHLAAIDRTTGKITTSFNDVHYGPMSELAPADIQWALNVTGPSVSRFVSLGKNTGNLVAIPSLYGHYTFVAFVPVAYVKKFFFDTINRSDSTMTMLVDDDGTCMIADKAELTGEKISDLRDGPDASFWNPLLVSHTNTAAVLKESGQFGSVTLPPRVSTGTMVPGIPGTNWIVVMTTPLKDIGTIVDSIFSGVLFWAIVLVVAMTAILVSTAVQAIRARARVERERAALLDRELKEARQIQLSWLPDAQADFADVRVAAANLPASHISGDFYNWFELADNRIAVLIGDVTGHGMSAAFLMSTTQLLLRALLLQTNDLGRSLTTANRLLCAQAFRGQFVTVLALIIDPEKSTMEICSAGHQAPLVDDGTGEGFVPLPLETELVLGVERSIHYTPTQFAIRAGSTMLLYTDGAIECRNGSGQELTTKGLCARLRDQYPGPQDLIDRILREVKTHTAGAFDDDVTLVALRMHGGERGRGSVSREVGESVQG